MLKNENEKLTIQIPYSIIEKTINSSSKHLNITLNFEFSKEKDSDQQDSCENLAEVYSKELSGVAALSLRFS